MDDWNSAKLRVEEGHIVKARDWYGLAIRVAGLVFVIYAIFDLTHLIAPMFGAQMPNPYPTSGLEFAIAVWLVLGLALTFGAGILTRMAYGRDDSN